MEKVFGLSCDCVPSEVPSADGFCAACNGVILFIGGCGLSCQAIFNLKRVVGWPIEAANLMIKYGSECDRLHQLGGGRRAALPPDWHRGLESDLIVPGSFWPHSDKSSAGCREGPQHPST